MKHITVVISTDATRPEKLLACLGSIRRSSSRLHHTLVLQQTNHPIPLPDWVETHCIPQKGVSFSKNTAIRLCRTKLIAFTDDDCVVDKHWLKNCIADFDSDEIDAVYGRVMPYALTRKPDHVCPAYLLKDQKEVVSEFILERTHFGIGNNMAFRVSTLKKIAGFTEWLGPGKIAKAAEDVELLFRLLITNHTVLYDPKVIVHHDRWMTWDQNRAHYYGYFRGMLAAYSYHMYRGNNWAKKIVARFWNEKAESLLYELRQFSDRSARNDFFHDLHDVVNFLIGMGIGKYHSLLKNKISVLE